MAKLIKDGVAYNTAPSTASQLPYNNSTSGLSATDVKGAIDELTSEKMEKSDPTGTGSLSMNRKASTTVGTNSITLGTNNTASGVDSFAEGNTTSATGARSHAEGYGCVSGGADSHAEGRSAQSSGELSHAQGLGVVAQRKSQFVFGEWNIADTGGSEQPPESGRGTYVEIVGNGNGSSSKSNARTLDWSGNEVLAGDLTIMGTKSLNGYLTPSSTMVGNFHFYKYGRYVFCTMVSGNVTTNASGNVVVNDSKYIIPDSYKPIDNCESMATLPNARCVFTTTGEILLPNNVSQTITLRVSGSWLSATF